MRLFFLVAVLLLWFVGSSSGQDSEQGAQLLLQQAYGFFEAEQADSAIALYNKLVPFLQENNKPYWLAQAYLYLGECYHMQGSDSLALDYSYRSKAVLEENFRPDTVLFYSLLLQNLGVFHGYMGDFDEQMDYYRRSFRQAEKRHGRKSKQMADAYLNLGAGHGSRGYWDRCIAYTDTSLRIAEEIGFKDGVNDALHNLAYAYGLKRDFQRAVDYQERALRQGESLQMQAKGLHNLGYWYFELGNIDRAMQSFYRALEIRKEHFPENQLNIVSTKLALSDVFHDGGYYDRALVILDTVVQVLRPQSSPYSKYYLQSALNKKAGIYIKTRQFERARSTARQAILVDNPSPAVTSSSYIMLAAAESNMGQYEEALNHLQVALNIVLPDFDSTDPEDNPTVKEAAERENALDALHAKGAILYLMGLDRPDDLSLLKRSLKVYELQDSIIHQMRLQFQYPRSKEALFKGTRPMYSAAMRTCNALYRRTGDPLYLDLAFQYSEKNKGQLVAENLNDLYVRKFARVDNRLIEEERKLLSDIEFYQQELQVAEYYYGAERAAELAEALGQARMRLKELWSELEDRHPDYYKIRHAFDVEGLQAMQERVLEAEETLLEFFLGDTSLYIVVVDREGADFVQRPLPASFERDVIRFREAILKQEDAYWQLGHYLYRQLVEPVAHLLKGDKLCIVTDGVLGYIPFETLLVRPVESDNAASLRDQPFLMMDYRIRYLISGQVALQAQQRKQTAAAKSGILAMAPAFDGGVVEGASRDGDEQIALPRLDGAIKEVAGLKRRFAGLFLQNHRATEKAFRDFAPHYSVLHIATHTLVEDQFPSFFRLLFNRGSDPAFDGQLKAYEIYGMPLEADLITLSACNTGYGAIKEGEGIYSLGRAFAYAGASNLVMTLWPVKDKTTAFLVERFYNNLAKGMGKADALQEAKAHYLAEYPSTLLVHPYYWAGYLYMGDNRPVDLRKKRTLLGIPLDVFLPALLGLLFVLILVWRFVSPSRS
jgi:CHAT domain-containing protein